MNGWLFDIEADNLYLLSSETWYIKFKSIDRSRSLSVYPFRETREAVTEKITSWINSFDDGCLVVGHNILGYDLWMLWKHFNFIPRVGKKGADWLNGKKVQYVDTYTLSQYLNPDSPFHSLDYLSRGSENEKMGYRAKLVELGAMTGKEEKGFEFTFWHELMQQYCDDDVDATLGVFNRLWKQAEQLYGDSWLHASFRQFQKDYWLYSAQAYTGAPFNLEKANNLINKAQEEMDKLRAEVEPHLPPRPLKAAEESFYRIPAKPFKKNGELSATFEKWLEKHNAILNDGKIFAYDQEVELIAGNILPVKLPLEIDDNMELKQFFLDAGWKPHDDFWNHKKGEDGKPLRVDGKYVKTTPKIAHQGKICPNLSKIDGDIPKKVVKFLSYRNRLGVVTGWVNNWRMVFDQRLSAEISGYTPTTRVKHKTLTNCPKASPDVLLGEEMRDLFYAPKGFWYIGTDAAALENRTVASYTTKYDNGKFADLVLNGDSHSFNAFAFFPHLHDVFDINDPTLKDNPDFKPWRNKAKTGAYLLAYGGGVAKLASSLGLSKKDAQVAYDNYWKMNEGLGKLKQNIERYYDTKGNKKHIPAWDGRFLSARGKNILINLAGQSCGAIAMSLAACLMDAKLGELLLDNQGRPYYNYRGKKVMRISLIHDEYSWLVEDGIEEEIRQMSVDCIIEAGVYLKLPLPLDGEGKMSFEGSWKDVH
jgi:hypothetical protein